ncbi:MAG TPA: hypothetical protein PLP29_13720 [Candidatus Ozemobacteraceae bacterium]|nr:hypothetical protein [Candidatus Ozemobacteraceae bacterium]
MTNSSECRMHRDGTWLIITPVGYLNDQAGSKLNTLIGSVHFEGIRVVLFDFGETLLVNSQGIACLLDNCDALVDTRNLKVAFCRMPALVREAFSLVGLLELVSSFGTEQEARSALGNG